MNLINIEQTNIDGDLIETVNARELHTFLEVGRDFPSWVKSRIKQYGFVEGQDFTTIMRESSGGRPRIDYAITVDAALQIVMRDRPEVHAEIVRQLKDRSQILKALQNFDFSEVPEDMYVYMARNTQTGNIKIGISKDPNARIKQLQVGSDSQLELVAQYAAPNRFNDETMAHQVNKAHHIRGEWFNSSAKLTH